MFDKYIVEGFVVGLVAVYGEGGFDLRIVAKEVDDRLLPIKDIITLIDEL